MDVTVLGAAREVGRSAFLVKGESRKLLLDCGVLMRREPSFPIHVKPKDVDDIILTHAHLDHSGAAPIYFLSNGVELHSTPVTAELTRLLITDFIQISGTYLPYEFLDLMSMMNRTHGHGYRDEFRVGEFTVTLLEAGHIPGGASVLLETGGKRILYTGDFNENLTQLIRSADTMYGDLDLVITESTYATSEHPPREEAEAGLVKFAREIVESGGTLLVPAFSVGRAQEIACVLRAHNFQHHVAMDGMALKTNEILCRYQEYLRDPNLYRKSMENVEAVTSWSQRRKLVKTPSVIIAPAGMLVGGSAVFYNSEVADGSRNGIAVVSYQIPGTPGRTLIEKGMTLVKGRPKKVKAQLKRFDFSSHSGRSQLLNLFKRIGGSPRILTVHGEEEACTSLANEIRSLHGLDASAPLAGEKFAV